MVHTYGAFALTLTGVSLIGLVGICERCGVGRRVWRNVTAFVAMISVMTVAAVVSLAFLAQRIPMNGSIPWLNNATVSVADLLGQMALIGNCGFLWALVGVVAWENRLVRHWAGGCLLASMMAMVLLLPWSAALIVDGAVAA